MFCVDWTFDTSDYLHKHKMVSTWQHVGKSDINLLHLCTRFDFWLIGLKSHFQPYLIITANKLCTYLKLWTHSHGAHWREIYPTPTHPPPTPTPTYPHPPLPLPTTTHPYYPLPPTHPYYPLPPPTPTTPLPPPTPTTNYPYYPLPPPTPTTPYHHPLLLQIMSLERSASDW